VENYEGAHGCDLNTMKAFAVGLGTKIQIFDDAEFQLIQELNVEGDVNAFKAFNRMSAFGKKNSKFCIWQSMLIKQESLFAWDIFIPKKSPKLSEL
jgi:hypothetical protein